jgi:hypothetical protein
VLKAKRLSDWCFRRSEGIGGRNRDRICDRLLVMQMGLNAVQPTDWA